MAGLLDSPSRDSYFAKRAADRDAYFARRAEMRRTGERDFTGEDAAKFIAEATPIIGDAMAAKEVWDEATSENPNWALVGALGGATLLGLIPGVGDAAAKAVKAGARGLLDTAKRVEVDPNTMGSLLGNVRLKPKGDFDVTRKDASGTFGEGSERVRYTDPKSKSTMEIVVRPDGSASVLDLVVPEGSRGKGLGQSLQAQVMQDFPMMGGQVSSKAAATTAYRLGRRPVGQPDATLDDVFATIDDMSSVNLVSPDMQKKLTPSPAQEVSGLLAPAPPKIRAYQGTPHKFSAERLVRMPDGSEQYIVGSPDVLPDIPAGAEVLEDFPLGRMRMDKIGTGEGAQVYGHGIYSAEAEDVARVYKDQLSGGASSAGQAKLDRYKGDIDAALNDTLSNLKRLDERELSGDFVGDEKRLEVLRVMHTKVLRQLDDYKANGVFSSGSMYEIDINADPENFLDWDKTVGSQSQNVKSLLGWTPDAEQAYLSARNADDDMLLSALSTDVSGQNYAPTKLPIPAGSPPYSATGREIAGKSNLFGSGVQAAEVLKGKGIPGIKYLDADSRSAGQGSRNYVVFDEKLINIVKRYGVAGAATMLGVTAMDVEQAMAQGVQQPSGLLTPNMINSQQVNQRPYNAGLLQ